MLPFTSFTLTFLKKGTLQKASHPTRYPCPDRNMHVVAIRKNIWVKEGVGGIAASRRSVWVCGDTLVNVSKQLLLLP